MVVEGSPESARLSEIIGLLNSCDKQHFEYQRQLVNNAMDPDSVKMYTQKSDEHQLACITSLKTLVREDYSSLASLYAMNYIDPSLEKELLDSVFCFSKKRYPNFFNSEVTRKAGQR